MARPAPSTAAAPATAAEGSGDDRLRTLAAATGSGSANIASQLRQTIIDGLYRYGEQLPAERQLAETFGSSRTTIRRALERLEENGLVLRQVGSGTFVNYRGAGGETEIAEVTSPLELMEVRFAVESSIARLAVLNATPRDLEQIAEALHRLEAAGADADRFTRCDQEFHLALARGTRNPLMVDIYRQINAVRSHAQWHATKDKILSARTIADYNRQHRALFEALRRRDGEGMAKLMTAHLTKARADLLGADSR
ncbi:MAG: FadR family transcriptional regulator [Alphaproteobacteria bacterium]|nr:FadR family transcriptional regulator [Alphaproteobacteria bacterium]